MRIGSWFVALLPFFFCACGDDGDDGGDDQPRPPSSGSGRLLWSVTTGWPHLRGIDTGSGEVKVNVEVAEGDTDVFSIVPAKGQVWLGRDDGHVVVVDQATGAVEKTLSVGASTTYVSELAVGDGSAYFAIGGAADRHLLRVDTRDFQIKADVTVVSSVDYVQGVVYDGDNVFVLSGNAFAALKLDASTLETQAVAGLGASEDLDVLGPNFYGVGFMTQVENTLWVMDTSTDRLLKVDKRTMTATIVSDVSDLLEPEGYTELAANDSDFFLALYDARKIVRFDGTTGARKRTYEPAGGVSTMAVTNDRLYVAPADSPHEIQEIDIETGNVTHVFEDQAADKLAVE